MLVVFSRVLLDSRPRFVSLSIRPSIHPFIHWFVIHTLLFQRLWVFWACRSCPNTALTSNTAPDHPHATVVALYMALLVADWLLYKRLCPSISLSISLCEKVEKNKHFRSCPPVWDMYWLCIQLCFFSWSKQIQEWALQEQSFFAFTKR